MNIAADPLIPRVRATVFTGRWPKVPFEEMPDLIPTGTFPPTTATLVSGASEIVLIDALCLAQDVQDLGDLIERTGKRLTTIYITHAHFDHYFGIGPLLERFPEARCVALPNVVEAIKTTLEEQLGQAQILFGDACVSPGPMPSPLEGDTLQVDGAILKVIEVKQADIHPTSIVHIPEIDTVIAGDAVYNEIHPMLALSTPSEWQDWLETLQVIEDLQPKVIIGGHRRPDADDHAVETMLSTTRSYIRDFADALESAESIEALVGAMMQKYPHHGNVWSLMFSAASAIGVRDGGMSVVDAVASATQ